MRTLRKILTNRLAYSDRVAVLGIGSTLRADDVAGMLAAEDLKKILAKQKKKNKVKIFFGETAPENLTGEIKKFKPSHIILIDTLDGGKKAGSIYLFKPEEVAEGASFSTHKIPAKILTDYLSASCDCLTTIIGIQPKTIDFDKKATKIVKASAKKVAVILAQSIT